MASGFSLYGSRPPCYPFFQEFYVCYASSENPDVECKHQWEDFQECRTHKKESDRVRTIIKHQQEKEQLMNPKTSFSSILNGLITKLTT